MKEMTEDTSSWEYGCVKTARGCDCFTLQCMKVEIEHDGGVPGPPRPLPRRT